MLLKALAPSNVSLLAVLCEPQVLQRVELSLRTFILFQVRDVTWTPAWHAVHDLQRTLSSARIGCENSQVRLFPNATLRCVLTFVQIRAMLNL
jgi:hypothetical protein